MPGGNPDPDAVLESVRKGIEDAFGRNGELPTKWVLIAEALGSDGERGLWLAASRDSKPWETLDMMDYAIELERKKVRLNDDD
jgi:hypothetical protein